MNSPTTGTFSVPARLLHWSMAIMVMSMLFIGIGMVATVSERHVWLLQLHKPLGIAILALVIVRLFVRWRYGTPALPSDLPPWQRAAAHLSHWMLYALMLAMPLIGWTMLSAGGYPVTLFSGVTLPDLLSPSATMYSALRFAHTWLALSLFAVILIHLTAALYHGLIRRDGVLASMTKGQKHP
ncbi:cytochrome B [Salinicola sp. MH3R3-1]|uniref:cytochrome b n=1 Tax=Salinicola sp. MH3R3-1 TaxID=1928762 RepID=UPI00094E8644|nr:cytochrome b [Salinicola sp. MH3R3-1]OLO07428.1 cytochrome B [Salinicola sp. MH3R3-1]